MGIKANLSLLNRTYLIYNQLLQLKTRSSTTYSFAMKRFALYLAIALLWASVVHGGIILSKDRLSIDSAKPAPNFVQTTKVSPITVRAQKPLPKRDFDEDGDGVDNSDSEKSESGDSESDTALTDSDDGNDSGDDLPKGNMKPSVHTVKKTTTTDRAKKPTRKHDFDENGDGIDNSDSDMSDSGDSEPDTALTDSDDGNDSGEDRKH